MLLARAYRDVHLSSHCLLKKHQANSAEYVCGLVFL